MFMGENETSKANYIIFHPDRQRECVEVKATAIKNAVVQENWNGKIWVDQVGQGNEDPFVFHSSWIYSYCHASQLRRKETDSSHLQKGSKLIFVSGDSANNGSLLVDTVFEIADCHLWNRSPLKLPVHYDLIFEKKESYLWNRHFKFPFLGIHRSVSHTYEARMWEKGLKHFSFLPLDEKGDRVEISVSSLSKILKHKILGKVDGKYPVLLETDEIQEVLDKIEDNCNTKVVGNIDLQMPITIKKGVSCSSRSVC